MKIWQHLRWKIVAANMLVAAVAVSAVLVSSAVFTRSLLEIETNGPAPVSIEAANSGGSSGESTALLATFQVAVRRAFVESFPLAITITVFASLAASLLLTQGIMIPYMRWARRSRRISSGLYVDRLVVYGDDELAEVAASFNRMAEALEEVQERRVALVGYLSHELRTPLSGVSGYIEGIMDGVFPDTDATLALMYGEVRRMRRLVDDLQALSRVQSGQVSLRMGTFELPPFVRQATVKLQPQWINSGIDVIVEQPRQALVVYADPDRVDQILLNLLANSLANTPEGGKVTVEILRDGDFARIDVTDTGSGIAAEEIPHIFERYYRANNTGDRPSGGSGIGLTISRYLAWAMGGELIAKSEGPGKGSTFSLMLPISKSYVVQN